MISFMLALLTTLHAHAGIEVGNGGDAIVCRDSGHQITSAELFDYYEARVLEDVSVDLGPASLSVEEKLEIAFRRLERFSPYRAAAARQTASSFYANTRFVRGDLSDVPDSGNVVTPEGCAIEQIAIQQEPTNPRRKRFTINEIIWEKLDNSSKAGLILHEILYLEARRYDLQDSVGTRFFNSSLAADLAPKSGSDTRAIQDFHWFTKFAVFEHDGIPVISRSCGYSKGFRPTEPKSYCEKGNYNSWGFEEGQDFFRANGYFASGDGIPTKIGGRPYLMRQYTEDYPMRFEIFFDAIFFENYRLKALKFPSVSKEEAGADIGVRTETDLAGARNVMLKGDIYFHDAPNAPIKCAHVLTSTLMDGVDGEKRWTEGKTEFDLEGRVIRDRQDECPQ